MDPLTQEQYRAHVEQYARIGIEILADEPGMSQERLTNELHEWLNAPDSFFNWHDGGDAGREAIALDVLRWSEHRHAGADVDGIAAGGEVNFEYLAAWAFVADVLVWLDEVPA